MGAATANPVDNELDLDAIDWVIVGGESGQHLWEDRAQKRRGLVEYLDGAWQPRDDRTHWVEALRDRCVACSIPFFFKQWGGATSKAGGRQLDGCEWGEYPPTQTASGKDRSAAGT